jgi:1,4-alpha-glucan branching enzyme
MVKRFMRRFLAILALANGSEALAQSSRPGWGAVPYADSAGTGVTFRVWAPNASALTVFGGFNGWNTNDTPLVKEAPASAGIWSADVPAARPGDHYLLSINHTQRRRDPRARAVVHSGPGGPGIIYDPAAYAWTAPERRPPPLDDLALYELHIGTFNHSNPSEHGVGTFQQAIEKLDHVAALGFNAISLMPVAEFAGNNSWGYNPSDPFAVESAYGGPEAFKAFVDACHQRNLAVILDVVHNHYGSGDLENSLWNFDGWTGATGGGIYFFQDPIKAQTPWGPRPDYSRPQVRDYIRDNVRMWLDEFRVDGLRWDATLYIRRTTNNLSPIAEGTALLRDLNAMLALEFPEKILIAEDLLGDDAVVLPVSTTNGLGFHSQWDRSFHVDLTAQITNAAARNLALIAAQMTATSGARRVVYTESHDEVGYLNLAEGARRFTAEIAPADPSGWLARKQSTLGAALAFTAPGLPMVFQGQEMLENEIFSTTNGVDWSKTNTFAGIGRLYADLAGLRRNRGGATAGLRGEFAAAALTNNGTLLLVHRGVAGHPADDVFIVANFSASNQAGTWLDFPAEGTWHVHFNSDHPDYGFDGYGSSSTFVWPDRRGDVSIAPWSVLVLSQRPPAPLDSDRDGMPDAWEIANGFDPHDPADAWLNPDGDAGTNLEEFRAGTDPRAWNLPASAYARLAVAGSFNAWSTSAAFMARIADHLWQRDLPLSAGTHQFKFAANDAWTHNWGADAAPAQPVPVTAPAVLDSPHNIVLTNLPAGIYRFRFDEARQRFTVRAVPVADSDGDNIPDAWELARFGSITGAVAAANPDGDLFPNLEEYRRNLDPLVWNPPLTGYSGLAAIGDFNGWNLAPNMVQATHAHYTWTLVTNLVRRDGLVFKFAADGAWDNDWGDWTPPHADWPLHSTAGHKGPDIPITKGFNGNYRFTFNEQTLAYSVVLADPDADGDGLPDAWELEHFGGITGADPAGNPDGDLYPNLAEYLRNTNPHLWDPPLTAYAGLAFAGTHNGWNNTPNMQQVTNAHHTWTTTAEIFSTTGLVFKIAANGAWDHTWGDTHPPHADWPLLGSADYRGADIAVTRPLRGRYRLTFNEQTLAYSFVFDEPDADGDGLPDAWELAHFGSITGAVATANPDDDLYDNFAEYIRDTHPHIWDPPLANLAALAVAGSFNGWNTAPNMHLVHHHTWRHVAALTNAANVAFKFATLNWAQDWGHARTSPLPLHGTAVFRGPNLGLSGTVHAAVVFTFNDQTLAYSVEFQNFFTDPHARPSGSTSARVKIGAAALRPIDQAVPNEAAVVGGPPDPRINSPGDGLCFGRSGFAGGVFNEPS